MNHPTTPLQFHCIPPVPKRKTPRLAHFDVYKEQMEIPDKVRKAAHTLAIYFQQRGISGWQYLGVADRNLCTQLEEDNARLSDRLLSERLTAAS